MSQTDTPSSSELNINPDQLLRISVTEEHLEVRKEKVETGRVRIHKSVSEQEINLDISLQREEVIVTRVPKNEDVEQAPQIRYEGDVTIISVVKEVAVVQKKLVLVEEIHIKRKRETEIEEVQTNVRKENIDIERI